MELAVVEEIWKPVPGYEGVYAVSSLGRVRRCAPGKATRVGRVLKPRPGKNGYLRLDLSRAGASREHKLHRLVALAFLGPPPSPHHEPNHCDGTKTNNRADNLEWATRSENARHAFRLGLRDQSGERHPSAKLTLAQVEEIRGLKGTATLAELGRRFGVSLSTIHDIQSGRRW